MKKIIVLFICGLVLIACNSNSPSETNSHTGTNPHIIIDWIDFVKIDGIQYEAIHGIIADTKHIGEEIGQVKFKVDENVTNPSYNIENGDAAYWEEGTKIFAMKDMPEFIVIKDSNQINGYQIYNSNTDKKKYTWHYQNLDYEKITKIEIYKGYDHPDLLQAYSDEQEIAEFIEIFNDGEEDATFIPDTSMADPMMYHIVYYDNEPIATTESLFFDGNVWYWYPGDIAILSNEISNFMKE